MKLCENCIVGKYVPIYRPRLHNWQFGKVMQYREETYEHEVCFQNGEYDVTTIDKSPYASYLFDLQRYNHHDHHVHNHHVHDHHHKKRKVTTDDSFAARQHHPNNPEEIIPLPPSIRRHSHHQSLNRHNQYSPVRTGNNCNKHHRVVHSDPSSLSPHLVVEPMKLKATNPGAISSRTKSEEEFMTELSSNDFWKDRDNIMGNHHHHHSRSEPFSSSDIRTFIPPLPDEQTPELSSVANSFDMFEVSDLSTPGRCGNTSSLRENDKSFSTPNFSSSSSSYTSRENRYSLPYLPKPTPDYTTPSRSSHYSSEIYNNDPYVGNTITPPSAQENHQDQRMTESHKRKHSAISSCLKNKKSTKGANKNRKSPSPSPERQGKVVPRLWSHEEDEILLRTIDSLPKPIKWPTVAMNLPNRSGKQCRERFLNHLNPNLKVSEWSIEEDVMIFHLYSRFGTQWSKMSSLIPGRTDNSIKNRFHHLRRKADKDTKNQKIHNNSMGRSISQKLQQKIEKRHEEYNRDSTAFQKKISQVVGINVYKLMQAEEKAQHHPNVLSSVTDNKTFRKAKSTGEQCKRCNLFLPSRQCGTTICIETGWCFSCSHLPAFVARENLRDSLWLRGQEKQEKELLSM